MKKSSGTLEELVMRISEPSVSVLSFTASGNASLCGKRLNPDNDTAILRRGPRNSWAREKNVRALLST